MPKKRKTVRESVRLAHLLVEKLIEANVMEAGLYGVAVETIAFQLALELDEKERKDG